MFALIIEELEESFRPLTGTLLSKYDFKVIDEFECNIVSVPSRGLSYLNIKQNDRRIRL